jgi:hypothetical protein
MIVALLLGLLAVPAATSDEAVEILSLRYRTADEVLPVLEPLVEGRGAITGSGTQIFVRASAARIAEVKRALTALDTRPRDLWISVRQASHRERSRTFGGSTSRDSAVQGVRTLDGRPAEITIGRDVAVHERGAIVTLGGLAIVDDVWFETLGTGFSVIPRLVGERFSIDIVTRHAPGGERARTEHELRTSVQGELGTWIEIGHVLEEHAQKRSGLLLERRSESRGTHSVEVKVELVEP